MVLTRRTDKCCLQIDRHSSRTADFKRGERKVQSAFPVSFAACPGKSRWIGHLLAQSALNGNTPGAQQVPAQPVRLHDWHGGGQRRATHRQARRPRQPRDRQHAMSSSRLTLSHQVPADPPAPHRFAGFDAEIRHVFPIDSGETGV